MSNSQSVFRNLYYAPYNRREASLRDKLFKSTKDSLYFVQRLKLLETLPVHEGCVNTISWNETGEYLLSGSDDQHLCITSGTSYKVLTSVQTRHRANIFSAKFLPNANDKKIVSCSGDGLIIYTELDRPDTSLSSNCFKCHLGTAYKIVTIPNDPNSFLSCGEDGTVRCFDLRTKTQCNVEECKEDTLINCQRPVTALAVDPVFPCQLAIGCCDSSVRIYDRRMLGTRASGNLCEQCYHGLITKFTVPEFEGKSHRITSLVYSPNSREVLVSYSSEYLYLFCLKGETTAPSKMSEASLGEREGMGGASAPPPMKRLRLRGDWSDTGPNARPEREMRDTGHQRSLHANLMQHVSDVLTRMLNDSTRQNRPTASESDTVQASNVQQPVSQAVSEQPDVPSPAASLESDVFLPSAAFVTTENSDAVMNSNVEPMDVQTEASPSLRENEETDIQSCSSDAALNTSETLDATAAGAEFQDIANGNSDVPGSSVTLDDVERKADGSGAVLEANSSNCDRLDVESAQSSRCQGPSSPSTGAHSSHDSGPDDSLLDPRREKRPLCKRNSAPEVESYSTNMARSLQADAAVSGSSGSNPNETVGDDAPRTSRVSNPGISGGSTSWTTREVSSESDEGNVDDDSDSEVELQERRVPAQQERSTRSRSASPFDIIRSMDEAFRRREEERENEDKFVQHLPQPTLLRKFTGHRNARTMIKEANFWGDDYVMSGSDCGHVFMWNRHTGTLVMILEADRHVVNCLQPHPYDPVLATSGIDYDIKLWAPSGEEPYFDENLATVMMTRNEVMLEETRDTITVPASFMIRMLASFNHLRQGGLLNRWRRTLRNNRPPPEDD